jgi:hypothetical protein
MTLRIFTSVPFAGHEQWIGLPYGGILRVIHLRQDGYLVFQLLDYRAVEVQIAGHDGDTRMRRESLPRFDHSRKQKYREHRSGQVIDLQPNH